MDLWNPHVALAFAYQEDFELSEEHWKIIAFLRHYYDMYQIAPAVHILEKQAENELGISNVTSYLYELFPYGPGEQANKYAGLPKPTNCL